ncbi:MAG: lysine 2,3-aminomutase [Rhodospirillaceae bacterium]|nr:lysine 2,3-aminomutase [Rhodospirillaceae bacterium]
MSIVRNIVHSRRRKRIANTNGLLTADLIKKADEPACTEAALALPIGIPAYLASRLQGRNTNDPLIRQFVPNPSENTLMENEFPDPIGDRKHSPVSGIIHRYPDRVLLMPVLACPVYCRFCFRRHSVGDGLLTDEKLNTAFSYIEENPDIWEVILTGGDPLILSPSRLSKILIRLNKIPHVRTIRIHSRVPALDPIRIDNEMINALKTKKPIWLVLHSNHADELDSKASVAIAKLIDNGIPMLSQTVLLKGVNDTPKDLENLFRTLIENRVKPYYLHHGDLAKGTSHFRTTLSSGRKLMKWLRRRLSGIAQPVYVLDIPGGHGKVPAGHCWIESKSEGEWIAEDISGKKHKYFDEIEPN